MVEIPTTLELCCTVCSAYWGIISLHTNCVTWTVYAVANCKDCPMLGYTTFVWAWIPKSSWGSRWEKSTVERTCCPSCTYFISKEAPSFILSDKTRTISVHECTGSPSSATISSPVDKPASCAREFASTLPKTLESTVVVTPAKLSVATRTTNANTIFTHGPAARATNRLIKLLPVYVRAFSSRKNWWGSESV